MEVRLLNSRADLFGQVEKAMANYSFSASPCRSDIAIEGTPCVAALGSTKKDR